MNRTCIVPANSQGGNILAMAALSYGGLIPSLRPKSWTPFKNPGYATDLLWKVQGHGHDKTNKYLGT